MKRDYSKLQNGSDIRGIALYENGNAVDERLLLNEEIVARLTKGFLFLVRHRTEKDLATLSVAVGHDSRVTGITLAETVIATLSSYGVRVEDAGLASTPALFMATVFPAFSCNAAIMLTASHMPPDRNGMKFFLPDGGLDKDDITDIINFAESDQIQARLGMPQKQAFQSSAAPAVQASADAAALSPLMSAYCAHLKDLIQTGARTFAADPAQPLRGLHIVVDAGNGAGGFFVRDVLKPLGADCTGSQFLEPDGTFPNHIPNPENRAAMDAVCSAVKTNKADLGLIFDTDVDRAAAVDETGREIGGNRIIALAASLLADERDATVVTDSVTSPHLKTFLEDKLGLRHLRYKRGYRNVINKATELNAGGVNAVLAIETSGHAAYKENYFLDDGAYLATRIVIKAAELKIQGKTISSLIADMTDPVETAEFRLSVQAPDFAAYADRVLAALAAAAEAGKLQNAACELPNFEGVRLHFTAIHSETKKERFIGWCLLRKSLHEPLMPLNVESDVKGGARRIVQALLPVLSPFEELDISKLKNF